MQSIIAQISLKFTTNKFYHSYVVVVKTINKKVYKSLSFIIMNSNSQVVIIFFLYSERLASYKALLWLVITMKAS